MDRDLHLYGIGCCGNDLVGQTYPIQVVTATAPTLTGVAYPGTTGTNACSADAATAAPFSAVNAIQGYTDNCGGAVTATLTNTVSQVLTVPGQ